MSKKTLAERIQEVMKNPERVRNIATSSHVHHGKCVSGDTIIVLENIALTAEELFELAKKKGKLVKNDEAEEIYDIRDLEIYTFSLTKEGTVVKRRVTHAWKLRNDDPMLEIKLKDGRKIKVTPEHKFAVFENGKIVYKEARKLRVGETIMIPTKIYAREMDINELKSLILTRLAEDYGFIAYVNKELKRRLEIFVKKEGIEKTRKEVSKLGKEGFYGCVINGRYRLNDLLKIANLMNLEISEVYDSIEFIRYRKGIKRHGTRISYKIRLPKTNTQFKKMFYLLGLMFGDGSTNLTFDNKDNKLLNIVQSLSKEIFGTSPKLKKYKNKVPRVYLNGGLTLKKLFNVVFEYPLKRKARNLKIPLFFLNLRKDFLKEFIRGYFDADGYIHQQLCLISTSESVIRTLQLILLRFNCLSYVRKRIKKLNNKEFEAFELIISGNRDLGIFIREIGFGLKRKEESLMKLFENSSWSKIFYPYQRVFNLISRQYERDVMPLSVSEIRKHNNERFVFDFTVEETHNFLANGFFIHNTTLTDNLMAGAGMLAEELAGKVMYTWFDEQERERQLTIYGANVSMLHTYEGKDYVINLIDTPGHVDFGGDVTRAMRAADGTIVLVCGVEGVMPQTETVFRQALRERVKPVLFINKVDRLIRELKLTPEQMQERFEKIIRDVNVLIQKYAEEKYKEEWQVSVANGTVAFGSAYKRWAISLPYMKQTGITFKDIIELASQGKDDELAKKAPLHQVVLDMVIKHLPSPIEAQKYRLGKIWSGDLNSQIGQDMLNCNPNGKLAAVITKMVPDPHVGFVATARIFSGKIYKGQEVYLVNSKKKKKVQQVEIYKGIQRIPVEEVTAGNIAAIVGIPEAFSGETICEPDAIIEPFEEIKHIFEPVVTKAVEPKNPLELTKIVEALIKIAKEDATLQVKINQETGEYLVSGLGELHLEAKVERKLKEMGFDIEMSKPIVVYRETVSKPSPVVEGKSPNKHNRFYIMVEPLEDGVYDAMNKGLLPGETKVRKKDLELFKKFSEYGMPYDEAKNIVAIHNKSVLIDLTKGVQFMNEVIEMVKDAFVEVMNSGPLAWEPCTKIKVKIMDAELHEDPVHRGPGQIMPAVRYAIRQAMLKAGVELLEPKQIIRVDVPSDLIGEAIAEIENRRGQIINIIEEVGSAHIIAKMPVSEMFGFDASLKSATSGRGFYSLVDIVFEKVPKDLFEKTVLEIRRRKGLKEEIPQPEV